MRTLRLTLDPLQTDHAMLLFESLQESALYRYINRDPPESVDELTRRYKGLVRGGSMDGKEIWLNWVAFSDAEMSPVGLFEATVVDGGRALLAYMVFLTFWKRGYAKEGCLRVIEFLQSEMRVTQVEALIDTNNIASIRLAESLGFRKTERIVNASEIRGVKSDEYRYLLD